jgi:hypothetical protein
MRWQFEQTTASTRSDVVVSSDTDARPVVALDDVLAQLVVDGGEVEARRLARESPVRL